MGSLGFVTTGWRLFDVLVQETLSTKDQRRLIMRPGWQRSDSPILTEAARASNARDNNFSDTKTVIVNIQLKVLVHSFLLFEQEYKILIVSNKFKLDKIVIISQLKM